MVTIIKIDSFQQHHFLQWYQIAILNDRKSPKLGNTFLLQEWWRSQQDSHQYSAIAKVDIKRSDHHGSLSPPEFPAPLFDHHHRESTIPYGHWTPPGYFSLPPFVFNFDNQHHHHLHKIAWFILHPPRATDICSTYTGIFFIIRSYHHFN